MGLIITLIVFVGLAAIIVWMQIGRPAANDAPQRLTLSISVMPAARSTEQNTKRNASSSALSAKPARDGYDRPERRFPPPRLIDEQAALLHGEGRRDQTLQRGKFSI
jgi:hypothetical protein